MKSIPTSLDYNTWRLNVILNCEENGVEYQDLTCNECNGTGCAYNTLDEFSCPHCGGSGIDPYNNCEDISILAYQQKNREDLDKWQQYFKNIEFKLTSNKE